MASTPTRGDDATTTWEALGTTVLLRLAGSADCVRPVPRSNPSSTRSIARAAAFAATPSYRCSTPAPARSTAVGPLLMDALTLALRAAELTGGDVDPTIGRALELADMTATGACSSPRRARSGDGCADACEPAQLSR